MQASKCGLLNDYCLELYKLITLEDYLQPLTDKLCKLTGNPAMMIDSAHKVLTHSPNQPIDNEEWSESIQLGHYNFDKISEYFYANIKRIINSKEPVLISAGDHEYAAYSIFCRKTLVGFVSVLEYNRKFSDVDFTLIKTAADIVSVKNEKNVLDVTGQEYNYSQIISDLINHKIESLNELKMRMQSRNWPVSRNYQVTLVHVDKSNKVNINYLKGQFMQLSNNFKVVVIGKHILIVEEFSFKPNEQNVSQIGNLVLRYKLKAGVSDSFTNLFDLPHYYEQAKKALEYSSLHHSVRIMNHYKDYRFMHFLATCCNQLNSKAFYHPALTELEKYDAKNNAELYATFFSYLDNGRSVHKTSEALHIHKNTVNNRVNKIKELLGSTMDDTRELHHIYLSFRLREMQQTLDSKR